MSNNPYILKATGQASTQNPELIELIRNRIEFKNQVWRQRNNVLENLSGKLNNLINIYQENQGNRPLLPVARQYYYLSGIAHQAWNILNASKLYADFVRFSPLGMGTSTEIQNVSSQITEAHKIMRYRGGYDAATSEAKSDLVWGESWIQFGVKSDKNGDPDYPQYQHAPFSEVRGEYGDTDVARIIDYPINQYVQIYGKEMLTNVAPGQLVAEEEAGKDFTKSAIEESHEEQKDTIQVILYYDPAIKLHAEVLTI
jgi:hypothetical protein